MSSIYPYIAKATVKYKSPHATDLSFVKGETIRVTGVSDEDEDWMIGESIDGERTGGFPRDFVEQVEDEEDAAPRSAVSTAVPVSAASAVSSQAQDQAKTVSEPERPETQPPAQPLPEAEAIPGSFNPEMAEAELKEDIPVDSVAAPEAEAVPAPMPVPISAPAPAVSNTTIPAPQAQPPTGTASPPTQPLTGDTPEPSKLSFKDRLAAFNKPKSTAGSTGGQGPPPLKPKPAGAGGLTWSQRQKIREEEERKAREAGGEAVEAVQPPPASAAEAAAPLTTTEQTSTATTTSNEEKSGMSASYAKASIGLSLKERMAALSGSQAFGGAVPKQEEAGEMTEKKPTKTWKRPEVAEGAPLAVPGQMPMPVPVRSGSSRSIEGSASNENQDEQVGASATELQTEGAEGEEEQSEEQKEKERRAAIAARMARLGGRGMFGGPPPPLAPKPGAQKKASAEVDPPTVAELDKIDTSFHATTAETVGVSPPAVTDSQSTGPAAATAPGGGIAMPAIPKRAAGPRRRGGGSAPAASSRSNSQTAPITGADQDAPPAEGQLAQDTPLATGAVADQNTAGDEDKALEEQAGSGPAGAEGAKSAGIAMHTPPAQVPQPTEEQDRAEDVALTSGTVPGQDLEHKADGPVLVGAEGDADAEYRGGPSDVVLGGGSAGISRMPPPPAPPGGFDSEDEQDDEDDDDAEDDLLRQAKSGQMRVEPSRIDVEEGLPQQPEGEEKITSPTSPVGFAPLHSPAGEVPASPRRGPASPISPVGGTNAALATLGLPRDEVELKHEQDAVQQEDDDAGEENEDEAPPPPPPRVERPADRPLGPRPMPNPPILGQTVEPELVGDTALRETDRTEHEIEGESSGEEEQEGDAPPPPPRRQESISGPAQVGLALPQDAPEAVQPRQAVASPPPVVSEEPQAIAPADEEATRRQNIAARMAKLGGIKLGGPPLGINTRQGSMASDTGLTSPMTVPPTPRSPVAEEPLSPLGSATPAATVESTTDANDESEEAAAVRRRATLARLQAGGHLGGFNMFSRNVEPQSPTVETTQGIANEAADVDERNLEPERIDEQENQVDPAASHQQLLVEQEMEEVSGDETGEAVPPPPPRRPTQMASPPQSPIGEAPMPSIRNQTSHGLADTDALGGAPSGILAPPIPIMPPNVSAEPEIMSPQERDEDDDAMGPPPPPRPAEIVTTAPSHQRSDSRASRISIGSRTSTGGGVPVSPTTPRRTSMQAGRPAYNELQQASSTFGSKVYRAAQKLAESGKRQSVGDGSSRSFVWAALGDAGIDANTSFGTLIWEQEGSTTHKRYDDARVGDVVVLHDAKLKGKKGLVPYTQQVGSVEEPMFAICAETEQKKNKVKVWQVERGHITTESYRLEDLQSGLVRVFRPMAQ